jgi:hypothetical protein
MPTTCDESVALSVRLSVYFCPVFAKSNRPGSSRTYVRRCRRSPGRSARGSQVWLGQNAWPGLDCPGGARRRSAGLGRPEAGVSFVTYTCSLLKKGSPDAEGT